MHMLNIPEDRKITETSTVSPMIVYKRELLDELLSDELIQLFNEAKTKNDYQDVKRNLRIFASDLFERQMITMNDYVSIFGGHALNYISLNSAGQFYDMNTNQEVDSLVCAYSRAKFGSIDDIRLLAQIVISMLSKELDSPDSHWRRLFETAKLNRDSIVMMTTGWRNVPSTANVLYDIVVEQINLKLTYLGLPTIINIKLPRIAPPCENYASLTIEEREQVNLIQDHIIPDKNFYQWSGVHVIFGDDILVTGATADKVFFESMRNGAKTFQSIYPIVIDPRVALQDAAIEEMLNMVVVKGKLDDVMANILSHSDYQPILRTLRLLFSKSNYIDLPGFLPQVTEKTWLRLYVSALSNEFRQQKECVASLELLKEYLVHAGLLDEQGLIAVSK